MITVLKFYADWCSPCNAMKPAWDQLKEDLKDEFIFQAIDIDANPQMRADYFVRSIPTIVLVKDGKEVTRKQGSATFPELKDWLYDEQGNL